MPPESFSRRLDPERVRRLLAEGLEEVGHSYSDDADAHAYGELMEEELALVRAGLQTAESVREKHGDDGLNELYEWYATAMQRRDREPLDQDQFVRHFFGGGSSQRSFLYGDMVHGYALGVVERGVFIPTHFALRTLKGGYRLLQGLGASTVPTVAVLTKDLCDTLRKMPAWHIEDIEIPSTFRDEEVAKYIVHNQFPWVQEKLAALAQDFLR